METWNCSICLDDSSITEAPLYWTPCGHIFHKSCFAHYTARYEPTYHDDGYIVKCPYCRTDLLFAMMSYAAIHYEFMKDCIGTKESPIVILSEDQTLEETMIYSASSLFTDLE